MERTLLFIFYLIMVHNIEQVLLKTCCSSIIIAHGPVKMSCGGLCCKQIRKVFNCNNPFEKHFLICITSHIFLLSYVFVRVTLQTGFIPLSDSSVNHLTPSLRRGPQQIFYISLATPFVPVVESRQHTHQVPLY